MTTETDFTRRGLLRGSLLGFAGSSLLVPGLVPRLAAAQSSGSVRKDWWKGEYRIVQTNLRMIDVRQDPVKVAHDIRNFGGNVIISNVGGIVAFYPSKLEFHYRNPYLKDDWAGRMLDASHAAGLAYVGRFDLSKATRPVFEAHPDWFMRNRDGSVREYTGTYQACPSGGWAQEASFRILEEALRRFPLDGAFFNMVGFTRTDYDNVDHGICVCENCRNGFRKSHGLELPATDGPDDPNWVAYTEYQNSVLRDIAKRTVELFRSTRPDAALMDFFAGDIARGEVQRRVDRPAPEWSHAMGEQTRWASAAFPGRPFSATSTAHIDYPWRHATESAANHLLRMSQALATGAKLDLYLIGTLADQADQSWLAPVSELYKWHARNEAAYAGLRPHSRIGLYSSSTPFTLTDGDVALLQARRGAYRALVDLRHPFDTVEGGLVARAGVAALKDFDVIVMPDIQRVSDAEAEALDAFVAAGGLVIATGRSGAFDASGNVRAGQAMASSPIDTFTGDADARGWSLSGAGAALDLGDGRVAIDGNYYRTRLRPGARDLVPFAPDNPWGPPEFTYVAPGAKPRPDAGVAAIGHGKGTAVHIPWHIDTIYGRLGLDAHRELIGALIARYAPPPPVRLEGNGAVELTVQRQPNSGAVMIHIVNYTGQRDTSYRTPPALHGHRLGLRGPVTGQVQALRAGTVLTGRPSDDGYTWFDLPPISHFEAVRVSAA